MAEWQLDRVPAREVKRGDQVDDDRASFKPVKRTYEMSDGLYMVLEGDIRIKFGPDEHVDVYRLV